MNLLHIKDIALKYSQAISTILDIDVVIIDSEYNKLAYTSKNVSNLLPISRMSVIGEVLHTGKVLIVKDNGKYPICTNCVDNSVCQVSGIISVPILYHDKPVGAVALLLTKDVKSTIFENMEPAIDFVESMADLLSFRLQNLADYDSLVKTKHETETVINTIDDGLISLNKDGEVSFCNNQFLKYFHITKDIIGMKLEEVMTHEKLQEILVAPEDKMVRSIFFEDKNIVFRGIVSKRNITINGVKIGVLLSFKSLRDSYSNFSSVLDQYETVTFERVKTKDPKIDALIDQAKALAVTDKNLLIQSEVGLEIFGMARSIHNFSDRASERFTTVHCTNKSYSDLETDLFGEEDNPLFGVVNLANHGTVLIYDVDEMPLYLQQRLLKVIKTKQYSSGVIEEQTNDIRFILHTHANLQELVEKRKFNEELYYRLIKNRLEMIPLRERKFDLPSIILMKIRELKVKHIKPRLEFDSDVLALLNGYSWPGNFTEMEKTLETIIFNAQKDVVKLEDVIGYDFFGTEEDKLYNLDFIEEQVLRKMLGDNMTKETIAEKMGISRATLYRKLKKYDFIQ